MVSGKVARDDDRGPGYASRVSSLESVKVWLWSDLDARPLLLATLKPEPDHDYGRTWVTRHNDTLAF